MRDMTWRVGGFTVRWAIEKWLVSRRNYPTTGTRGSSRQKLKKEEKKGIVRGVEEEARLRATRVDGEEEAEAAGGALDASVSRIKVLAPAVSAFELSGFERSGRMQAQSRHSEPCQRDESVNQLINR